MDGREPTSLPFIQREEGFVLLTALSLLGVLVLIGTTAFLLSSTDIKIGGNFKNNTQLLYTAMAGIEQGRETLRTANAASSTNCLFSDELAARVGSNGTLDGYSSSSDDVPLVSSTLNSTNYSVYLTNDAADGATNKTDTNGKALLTSVATGAITGKAMIQALVSVQACAPTPPGSLSIVGEAETSFSGNNFSIDGKDYLMNGNLSGTNPAKVGISISDISAPSFQTSATALGTVNTSLVGNANQVQGVGYVANLTPSVGLDSTLSKLQVDQWVTQLTGIADNILTLDTGGDVTGPISNKTDSNNNLTIGSKTINLGTTTNPKITILNGVAGGSVAADFQDKISGAGILIVKDNDLIFRKDIDWKGLIIVAGKDVGFGSFDGSGSSGIYGGVIVCETDTDVGYNEAVLKGNARIRASKEALDMVKTMVSGKTSFKTLTWKHVY